MCRAKIEAGKGLSVSEIRMQQEGADFIADLTVVQADLFGFSSNDERTQVV